MNLLVGVHLTFSDAQRENFVKFFNEKYSHDRNTFLLLFDYLGWEEDRIIEMVEKGILPKGHLLLIRTPMPTKSLHPRVWSRNFGPYKKSFERALAHIDPKLKKGEKIAVSLFGGRADECFANIAPKALTAIQQKFPKRVTNARSELDMVYGRALKNAHGELIILEKLRSSVRRKKAAWMRKPSQRKRVK